MLPTLQALDEALAADDGIYKAPATRALSSVVEHDEWLKHQERLRRLDARLDPHRRGRAVYRRESVRFVSASQNIAGHLFEDDGERYDTRPYITGIKRRIGLVLSGAAAVNRQLEAIGEETDWFGDNSTVGLAKG